jgi:serine/threonine protein kinase/Tol biopolymer transport system component
MPIDSGTFLGRYEIRSHLGAGGMGEVYLARDTTLDRTVALKLLPSEVAADKERMQRFMQEARTASALNHPNIITIHEIGEADSTHFIATEFIEGVTLRQHMIATRLSILEALDVAVQTTSALVAAHEAGIVHRDIKPENIMLRRDGYVKVLDFGLAKPTERQPSDVDKEAATKMLVNTSPGMVMGTVNYMSPEQTRGHALDGRTDIWSLGVVLYEMLTAHAPFAGETPSDVIVSVLDREPQPLTHYLTEAPVELQRILRKALRKDREERYQSVKEMLVDLRTLKQEMEFDVRLERSYPPEARSGAFIHKTDSGQGPRLSAETPAGREARTAMFAATRTTAGAVDVAPVGQERKRKKGIVLALVLVGALALLCIPLIYYWTAHRGTQASTSVPFQTIKFSRLTSTGKSIDAAISPDGKYVAHVVSDGAQRSIWVRQVATSRDAPLVAPSEAGYGGLKFSPDGNHIYYLKSERNQPVSELFQVSVLGGDSRKLATDVDTAVTFSPDGKRIAFMRNVPSEKTVHLILANADGSGEQKLASRTIPEFFWQPTWSPDGKVIALIEQNTATGLQVTVVGVSVSDGKMTPLTPQKWRGIQSLAWLPHGHGLMLTAPGDDTSEGLQIWHLSYPGAEVRRVTNDLNSYSTLSLTADSNTLAAVQSHHVSNIWVAPGGDASRAQQLTSGTSVFYDVSWMPDGRILYSSNVGGSHDIWVMDKDGSNQKQLTVNAGGNHLPSVSPDGRYIVFVSNRSAPGHNIWRMDADGSNPKQLTFKNTDSIPRWMPDGRWIIYSSWATGKPMVWKVSVDGGEPVMVLDKYAVAPSVSPDGKMLAVHYWNEQLNSPFGIALFSIDGGEPLKTFDVPVKLVKWSQDGRALLYCLTRGGFSNIWSQPIAGGAPKQLTDWKQERIFDFSWSQDNRQLVVSRGVITSDVVLINDLKQQQGAK